MVCNDVRSARGQDIIYSFSNMTQDFIRLFGPGIPLMDIFTQSISGLDEKTGDASLVCENDILVAVANHPAATDVDGKFRLCTTYHAGPGFAKLVGVVAVGLEVTGRMGERVVDPIKVRALFPEQVEHVIGGLVEDFLSEITACDTGLVGHDNGEVARIIEFADGLGSTIDKFQPVGVVDIPGLTVDRAVTVEKDTWFK